jgi:tetratricopeptide (TPR) repeat protein
MVHRSRGFGRWGVIGLVALVAAWVVVAFLAWPYIRMVAGVPADDRAHVAALAAISRYRVAVDTLPPEAAVTQWFDLYDRSAGLARLDPYRDGTSLESFDPVISGIVSERSLLASLPPPDSWQAFRAEATRRAEGSKDRRAIGLRYLAELLAGDQDAANATLRGFDDEDLGEEVASARATLLRVYGDAEARVAAFEIELSSPVEEYGELVVPDLVALAGQARATELLKQAVKSSHVLQVDAGADTRALAHRVGLANVADMKIAQWTLVQSIEAADLYEAMVRRFEVPDTDDKYSSEGWKWRTAAKYHFLAMVQQGRQGEAEKTLDALSKGEGFGELSSDIVNALQRAQLNEPLFEFLDKLLQRRPTAAAWDLYLEQAAFLDRSRVALARIDGLLARQDLTPVLRADLQTRRIAALYAADQLADAETSLKALLAPAPQSAQADLHIRSRAALAALHAGGMSGHTGLVDAGMTFARAASAQQESRPTDAAQQLRVDLARELRRLGRDGDALVLLQQSLAALEAKPASSRDDIALPFGVEPPGMDARQLLVEIAGIHGAAGRYEQVAELLKNSPHWAADDLAELRSMKDSRGVPLLVIAARALAATGDQKAALRAARAVVAEMPGNDAGYELIAALDPAAPDTLDELFALDAYEERPLIWKATLQLQAGQLDAAEATIRQAIAIDPSDGEEGPNDRMRAYRVLADILRKQGNAGDARLYANAVAAIRISEHADQLHAAGLYERAFRGYREALEKFSDAYCIQSRLAVQLNKQGRRQEALVHYRRAYELMPASFGRVESHCFGCENVFEGEEAQSLAEQVFTDVIRKTPDKPQAHYLLAYLREQQGRPAEALQPLRTAVSLDPRYLNAWKRLYTLGHETFIDTAERDIARLKLLELDPLKRHSFHDAADVGDLKGLWRLTARSHDFQQKVAAQSREVFRLGAGAAPDTSMDQDRAEEIDARRNLEEMFRMQGAAPFVLYEHELVNGAARLMGLPDDYEFD